ncbi:NAC domain-containing protein [Melia azedarach]|uniref:NAC domain-containing protein n=1 Tax=Melia azedarach TaxID=155640 RepID=A0ACC1XGL4_MELAZ|nr:NAC domain-containing protein [Melia azedarach]
MASSSTTAAEVSSQSTAIEESDSVVNTAPGIYSPINPESLLTDVVGTRFRPTDEILARHYLAGKVSGRADGPIFPLIKEVDVYKCEPKLLSREAHNFGDGIMYFFTLLKMKYNSGANVNRVAGTGFWKKTGNSSYVNGEDGVPIATKTPLAYYTNGQKPGESRKTQWLMKEFTIEGQIGEKSKTLALCVIYLHDRKRKQPDQSDKNVLLDDIVEGSFQNLASDSSCDRRSLIMRSTENSDSPGKRRRPSNPDFHIQDEGCFTTELDSSSNPAATRESFPADPIQSADSYLLNMVTESQGALATEPDEHIPYNYPIALTDFGDLYQPQHQLSELSTENFDFHRNQDSSNHGFNTSSNPSETREILPEVTIQSAGSNQNLLNPVMESQGATDTYGNILNYQSTVLDVFNGCDLPQYSGKYELPEDLRCLLYENELQPDVSEDPSIA